MEWADRLGAMYSFFPDTPAVAVDMALRTPAQDDFPYTLAYGLQNTSTPLDAYPADTQTLAG